MVRTLIPSTWGVGVGRLYSKTLCQKQTKTSRISAQWPILINSDPGFCSIHHYPHPQNPFSHILPRILPWWISEFNEVASVTASIILRFSFFLFFLLQFYELNPGPRTFYGVILLEAGYYRTRLLHVLALSAHKQFPLYFLLFFFFFSLEPSLECQCLWFWLRL